MNEEEEIPVSLTARELQMLVNASMAARNNLPREVWEERDWFILGVAAGKLAQFHVEFERGKRQQSKMIEKPKQ